MADRYWRGGAGTWNTTLTTNWAATSGAATGGASVPTAADNVFFDQAGTYTVTMTGALACLNITVSAGTVTFATGTAPTLNIAGNMSLISATVWNSTGAITFSGTTTRTINNNAVNIDAPINFNGVGGIWTLQSNFAYGKTAIRAMTLTNGTVNGNGFTITSLFASTMSSTTNSNTLQNISTTLAMTLTSGTLAANGSFGAFTFTAGTLNLGGALTTAAFTFTAGTLNLNNYTLTCTTMAATGATVRTFAYGTGNITCTGSGTAFTQATPGTLTVTGTPVVNITNAGTTATTVASGIVTEAQAPSFNFSGGAYTLTFLGTASYAADDVSFASGWAGTWAATSTGTIYGGLTLSSAMTLTVSTSVLTFSGTVVSTKTISPAGKAIPIPLTFNSSGSTYRFTSGMAIGVTTTKAVIFLNGIFDINGQAITLGFAGSTWSMNTNTINISNVSTNTTMPFTITSGTCNLTSCSFGGAVTFTAGTLNLLSNTTIGGAFTYTAGTININNWVFTVLSFLATGATTRVIAFGTGNISCTGTGTIWDQTTIGTFSYTGTPTVNITNSTTTAATVVSGVATDTNALNFNISPTNASTNYTLTILGTATHTLRNLTFSSNFTGTWAAIAASTIYGNLTLTNSMALTESTAILTFGGTVANTSKTITTAGEVIPFPITFNSSVSTWTLQDTLTMGITAARALIVTAGILDVNQKAITAGFAGSTMSTNGTVTIRNFWSNTTIPFTLTSGALTLTSTMVTPGNITSWRYDVGTITAGTATISYIGANFTFTAGTLTLGSDLWVSSTFTYTAGTIALSNYDLVVGAMSASGATTRVIQFGTGRIATTGTGVVWDQTTIGTFSFTGTSNINISNATTTSMTVSSGVATEAQSQNFTFWTDPTANNSVTLTFLGTATHTARNVIFDSSFKGTWNSIAGNTIYGDFQVSAVGNLTIAQSASALTFGGTTVLTKNFNPSNQTLPFPITFNSAGSTYLFLNSVTVSDAFTTTLTAGTINLNDFILSTGFFSSTGTGVRSLAFGFSGYIICTGTTGTLYTTATPTNLTYTGTSRIVISPTNPSGTITVATGAGTEAQAVNFEFNGSFALTFLGTASYSARSVTFYSIYSSFTGTWNATSTGTIYGDIVLHPSMTLTTSASAMTLGGSVTSGTRSIISSGKLIPFPIILNSTGSTWQLVDSISLATVTTAFTHTNGTLDLMGLSLTVGTYSTGVGTKELRPNSGSLVITGSGATAFNNANPTGYTVTSSISYGYGNINFTSASAKTFVGGGTNYDCIIYNQGGLLTISGNNTIYNLALYTGVTITGSNSYTNFSALSYPATITLTAGTTQTFTSTSYIFIAGSGSLISIVSATAGTPATIYKPNGSSGSVTFDYVSTRDIAFTPGAVDGTLPIVWYLGNNSTNLGNTTGAIFVSASSYVDQKFYIITNTATTSWTTPSDWSNVNTIYMIGAGGGGGGSTSSGSLYRAGGGGGGGGGYTLISNYNISYNLSIPVSVGIAGTGGTAASGTGNSVSQATAGTASKFGTTLSSLYGASFNGTSQYIQVQSPQSPSITTEIFCIEAWIYPTSFSNSPIVIENAYLTGNNQGGWRIGFDTAGVLGFYIAGTGANNGFTRIQSTGVIQLNVWTHIALVRTTGLYQGFFINGTNSAFTYQGLSLSQNSGGSNLQWSCRIGANNIDGVINNYFTGRISNVRIVVGSDVYATNFAPSRIDLTNITNTKLLTLQSATVIDNSTANGGVGYTLTNTGSVTTTTGDINLPIIAGGGGAGSALALTAGPAISISGDGGRGSGGTSSYNGGDGGLGASQSTGAYGTGGGGGGGAAGINGDGGAGGNAFTASLTATQVSGGGGGGHGGGTAGSNGTATAGGAGGYNYLNAGRGTGTSSIGGAGTLGGGGAGGQNLSIGGNAGFATDIYKTWGASGGGGGSAGAAATNIVSYGGGGAGAGQTPAVSPGTPQNGGAGGNGLILIQYTTRVNSPGIQSAASSDFFGFFG